MARTGASDRNTARPCTLAETQGVRALPGLLELAASPTAPAIVRATAGDAGRALRPSRHAAGNARAAAGRRPVGTHCRSGDDRAGDPLNRVLSAAPLLSDPVRGVRIEAARILADMPDSQIPEGNARLAQPPCRSMKTPWRWRPTGPRAGQPRQPAPAPGARRRSGRCFRARHRAGPGLCNGAYLNLADAWRQQGREAKAEKVLRRGLAVMPRDADLHHALGLASDAQGREGRGAEGIRRSRQAGPDNARYAYVQAIAVHSAGKRDEALALLRSCQQATSQQSRHPPLIAISRERGDSKGALAYAKQAAALLPDNQEIGHLVAELQGR
jgi:hypothetical protein